jgi:hypothetical protein
MNDEELIIARIRNQLRIHWSWLRKEEDYNEVADYIRAWARQVTSKKEKKDNQPLKEGEHAFFCIAKTCHL